MKLKLTIKFFIFFTVLMSCIYFVEKLLTPKYFYNETWSTTTTYEDFYDLEMNTADVIFLGSSHGMTFFNPQQLYDDYQITSFNLCSIEQSMLASYYWLKEACKTQSPKVVILDTYTLFRYGDKYKYNPINCSESALRRATDSMKLSKNKVEFVKEICRLDESQDALSYFLPNIRYHTRWNGLYENDFSELNMRTHGGIKGYSMMMKLESNPDFEPFEIDSSDETCDMVDSISVYLDKIVEFCDENEIILVLTCVPMSENIEKYNTVKKYAASHSLDYYDFNEKSLCDEIGYDYKVHSSGHGNYESAALVTDYIGRVLKEQYGLVSDFDLSFEASRIRYNNILKNYNLLSEKDVYDYLNLLGDERYSLLIFARNGYKDVCDAEFDEAMQKLGFNEKLSDIDVGYYYAVKDGTYIKEEILPGDFSVSGSIRAGKEYYTISTTKYADYSHDDCINISGTQCYVGSPGITIVVYDNDAKKIIDDVNISYNDGKNDLIHCY